jgi:hypothetical protein
MADLHTKIALQINKKLLRSADAPHMLVVESHGQYMNML